MLEPTAHHRIARTIARLLRGKPPAARRHRRGASGLRIIGPMLIGLLVLASSGCTNLRLPAIDPSGERIFLPAPNFTTLDNGRSFDGPAWSSLPQAPLAGTPAVGAAVVPYSLNTPTPPLYGPFTSPNPFASAGTYPPTGTIGAGTPFSPQTIGGATSLNPRDGIQGRLALSPERITAAVGQEVLVRAAICGADGYMVTREPLEWSLAANSVGTIVEVDQQDKALWRQLFGRPPYKRQSDFARGLTSSRPQVVPRGTPSPYDDLPLARGETWVTVTSSSPGQMQLHCLAPTVAGWETRRATSIIQWVGPGGASQPPTRFPARVPGSLPANAPAPSIPSIPTPATPPASQPPALPPAQSEPALPALTPDVELTVSGPRTAKADDELTYKITVRNTGRGDANDVKVSSKIPFGMRFVSSDPPAQVFGDRLVYRLSTLPPGQSRDITLRHIAERGGQMNICATLDYRNASPTEKCTPTTVELNALSVDVRGPTTVRVGERLPLTIQVTNHSPRDLTDVFLMDKYGSGLIHERGPSPIRFNVGTIPANQTRSFQLEFDVRGAGRLCHTVQVRAADGSTAETDSCVESGSVPSGGPAFDGPAFGGPSLGGGPLGAGGGRAALAVQKTGPIQIGVGGQGVFFIKITNTGAVPLNGLQVVDEFDPLLIPIEASYGVARRGNSMTWNLPQLGVGQTTTLKVLCEGGGPSEQACNLVRVTSSEGATGQDDKCVRIVAGGASWQPPVNQPALANTAPSAFSAAGSRPAIRLQGNLEPIPALSPVAAGNGSAGFDTSSDASHTVPNRARPPRSPFSPFRPLGSTTRDGSTTHERPTPANLPTQLPPAPPARLPREAFPGFRDAAAPSRLPTGTEPWQVDVQRRGASGYHDRITYTVRVTNRDRAMEENVVLTVESPQGTKFFNSLNPPMIRETRRSSDGRTVEFLPISTLRPDETATFQIVVRGDSPAKGALRVKIVSDRVPTGQVFTD